jgi:hypothetical protein
MTYADVTVGGRTHPDFGDPFPTWNAVELHDDEPAERQVATAAGDVQSLAIVSIWRRTGVGGWPPCPVHKTHPLWPYPDRSVGMAVWECRRAGYRIPVGDLPSTWG